MCGRYTLRSNPRSLADKVRVEEYPLWEPRYNVAPTTQIPVIREDQLSLMRWGLVPSWVKDLKSAGAPLINARAETVAEKPSFRSAFKKRRCLIPADGWYEWQVIGKTKQPFWIHLNGERVFAFAGLWEAWHKSEPPLESCTIVTTDACDDTRNVHDRMPVILDRADYARWLDPETDPASLLELLHPYDGGDIVCRPVGSGVGNVRNQGPECIEPVA